MLELGKYKTIVVSIALFLLLDASVLILNFYISFEISEDAIGVNLAGRQRMLSQRMVKSLFDTNYSLSNESERESALQELRSTVQLFDKTLNSFEFSGATLGASGEPIELAKVTSDDAIQSIFETRKIWSVYKQKLDSVLDAPTSNVLIPVLDDAITYADMNNLPLLKLMNDLTVALENVASSKANRLRIIQTIGISLAIVNFFIIMFHFLRQLRASDKKTEEARKETTEILETVNEGLFLLDRDLQIGTQYSKQLTNMFGREDIAHLPFQDFLSQVVSKKDLETAERYIKLFYREDINSNLITDLNPLKKVEVNLEGEEGGFITKFLSFAFTRVYENDEVEAILATVTDITEKVYLEKELEHSRKESEQQLELLTGILHSEPQVLELFVKNCFSAYEKINQVLKKPAKNTFSLRKTLDDVFLEVHNLKGESGALGLGGYEAIVHDFESNVDATRKIENLSGDDFIPLIVEFESLIRYTESINQLSKKLGSLGNRSVANDSFKNEICSQESWDHLFDLADSVAKNEGKQVQLAMSGLREVNLDESLQNLVNSVLIQSIRNSIVHGIEKPEDRERVGKKPKGRIYAHLLKTSDDTLELRMHDDGRGFDFEKIRTQAINLNRWSKEEISSWNDKQLVSLIFSDGLSTANDLTSDAGRGVGMNVIRKKIREAGGKISVNAKKGSGAQFVISIPYNLPKDYLAA